MTRRKVASARELDLPVRERQSDVMSRGDETDSPSLPPTTPSSVNANTSSNTTIIHTSLLIPGHGKPLKHASIIQQDGQITWVGATTSLPDVFRTLPSTTVPALMPGLWDCHTHLFGATSFNFGQVLATPTALAGARIARGLHDILMSGFTSIRDLGSYACEVEQAVQEGTIVGPNIYSAGAAISQTAGHGDAFDMPYGFVQSRWGVRDAYANNNAAGSGPLVLADGVDEVRRAVRLQIRRGAKVIKVFASGGVLSIADDPQRQQFSDEELATIVAEAARHGRIVAAHVHGKDGIMAALRAGVKTIEHGTYMDDECVELMKEKDIVYVPTRTIVTVAVDHPELMSPESYQKLLVTAKYHGGAYRLAVKSGVTVALGTDLGVSTPSSPLGLGHSGGELTLAVRDGGMTPLEAIEAGTANGPLSLGGLGMAPRSGRIEVGYDADLIALNGNPLDDMALFRDHKNITHVWKGGKLFKRPGMVSAFDLGVGM